MDPIPSRPAYRDHEEKIRIPVWLTKNGRHVTDTEMILLPSEAELLRERLTEAMGSTRSHLHGLLMDSPSTVLAPGATLVHKTA
ncbi:hypothetical protein [Streptomyces sp. NBC_01508]|uniref:hypothetical protein n=1 Tax=Streptomyces sp. NBC_01508 TaxID=2903888 RepID=UPI00386E7F64